MIRNLPANAGVMGSSLGQQDPVEEEMATHSVFLPGKSHGQRSLVGPWGHMTYQLNNKKTQSLPT